MSLACRVFSLLWVRHGEIAEDESRCTFICMLVDILIAPLSIRCPIKIDIQQDCIFSFLWPQRATLSQVTLAQAAEIAT